MVLSLILALLPSAIAQAQAQPTTDGTVGVLVRLEPGDLAITGTPAVSLQPENGASVLTIALADDGQPPDVSAGDGRFAGVVATEHRTFAVSLTIDGQTFDGGTVAWRSDAGARDLILRWSDGALTAQATAPDAPPSAAPSTPDPTAPPTSDGAPPTAPSSVATTPPLGPSGIPEPVTVSAPASHDGGFWIAFGAATLSLVGGVLLLRRGSRTRRPSARLERAPAPPMLGPGTPSLSRGVSIWTVPLADRPRFLQGILGTIAEHHRVLLILPPDAPVPMVRGGPVYVTRDARLRTLDVQLGQLEAEPGSSAVVVLVDSEPSADRIQELREVMGPAPGAVLLSTTVPAVHKIDIRAALTDTGALLHTAAGPVALVEEDYRYRRAAT